MALNASWQGHVTPDGGRVAAWFTSSGTMSMTINGTTFQGTATNGGDIAYCDFTGFDPDSALTATIYLDGVLQGTQNVWTQVTRLPLKGVWLSCVGTEKEWGVSLKLILNRNPDIVFFLGDMVYLDEGAKSPDTVFGVTRGDPENILADAIATNANAWNTIRVHLLRSSFQIASQVCPIIFQWDDHEIFSDFRNDLTQINASHSIITDQDELDAMKAARLEVATGVVHPANPGSAYYCSFTYGPVHFIVPDLVSEKGAVGGETMMGSTQLAWVKSELENAAPFKFIMSTKTATTGNGDSWAGYGGLTSGTSQLVNIWNHINDNSISTVVTLTGDKHWPHVQYNANPSGMNTTETAYTPYLGICPCPSNQFFVETGLDTGDIVYKTGPEFAAGYFEVSETQANYELVCSRGTKWRGYQSAGSNVLKYLSQAIAIG